MKKALREKIHSRILSKSQKELQKKSRIIQEKLLGSALFEKAKCICIYVSLPREAGTRRIIHQSLKSGKRVLVPLADVRAKRLKFYEIRNPKTDLRKGAYGILEPKPARPKPASFRDADLVIVPGVVFDRQNHRIGRGAGFYDRFLEKISKRVPKIGLAFSFQVVERVPRQRHDQRLDKVITDK